MTPAPAAARLSCSGDNGDVNSFTSTFTTRSGTGLLADIPGYADDFGTCSLTVTWADSTVVNRQVTLDPAVDTAVTLLRNGVTLQSDPFTSNDDDGVADALEAYAPNMGDGDADGTPDYLQADVASLPEDGGELGSDEDYLTVAGPDGSEMFSVATDEVAGARMAWRGGSQVVAGPPDGTQLLRGFLDFEVRNVTPGSTKTVDHLLRLHGGDELLLHVQPRERGMEPAAGEPGEDQSQVDRAHPDRWRHR